MTPPKPPARADKVSLWRYARLFRADILSAQRALRDKKKSVVILVSGVNGAGSGEVIRSLGNWVLDQICRNDITALSINQQI